MRNIAGRQFRYPQCSKWLTGMSQKVEKNAVQSERRKRKLWFQGKSQKILRHESVRNRTIAWCAEIRDQDTGGRAIDKPVRRRGAKDRRIESSVAVVISRRRQIARRAERNGII